MKLYQLIDIVMDNNLGKVLHGLKGWILHLSLSQFINLPQLIKSLRAYGLFTF